MDKYKFLLIIITAVIIAFLHFLVNPYRFYSYDYDLKLGEIAEKDIIAPFDFNVYKNQETLRAEQEAAAAKVQPIYKVSENLKFNAQKNLDFIFQHFSLSTITDSTEIRDKLQQNGYELSSESIQNLLNEERRFRIYSFLTEELSKIFHIGIYPDNYRYQKIKIAKVNRIIEYELKQLYSLVEAKNKLVAKTSSPIDKKIVREIADIILIENIVIDNEMTELEKQKAREKVPVTLGRVQKNEEIIRKNQKVTSTELLKLQSMIRAQKDQHTTKNTSQLLVSSLGVFFLSLLILFTFYYILQLFFSKNFSSTSRLIVLLGSLTLSVIFTIIVNSYLQIPSLIIPYSFSVLLIAIIFSPHVGITFNFVNLIFVSLFLNWSVVNPVILCLSTLAGIIALKNMKKRLEYYPLTLYLILGFLLIVTSISLIRHEVFEIFLWQMVYAAISVITSMVLLFLLAPIVERKLNMATKQILLELLDFDNPLLKKMSMLIPGTYHHSLIVGNLAESAAEAIGANHLLARVGSYYHDIGKLENPQFFVENNPNSEELHDKMMANESSNLIKNHIANGIALAKRSKLPKPVIEVLQQHHGTTKIRYFYDKAMKSNLDIEPHQFHYDGPKPQTKEAAIVMIADIVESTTKSLTDFSEDAINEVLDKTVKNLILEGQLNEAPLTMKELDVIKKYMLPILMGVYRKRLEYPE